MEIIKTKIEGNKKELSSVDLVNDGKIMHFTTTNLGFLKVSFSYENPKKNVWFQERFDIGKEDTELYKLTESIFFSYGGQVFFDSENSESLMLTKDSSKYCFYFCEGAEPNHTAIECTFVDDTTENESLKNFYYGLQDVKLEAKENNVSVGKSLKKSKKHIERKKDL